MGAAVFYNRKSAKTAAEAFSSLVDNALYEHGHGGYTGTIAEKNSFKVIGIAESYEAAGPVADKMIDDDAPCTEKWAPAACIDCGPDPKMPGNRLWLFFGWASS